MIERSERDGVAIVKLVHGKANAMDLELCQAIVETFGSLEAAPAQAIVLTGQGSIFSAGVDLIRISDGGPDYVRKFLPALNGMFDAVFRFPKPVVAAINGHAIAGGCVLACCADRRLMAHGAGRIGVTELQVGLPFPALAFEAMRLVTAPRHFPPAIYGGETYSSDDGAERGWVDEIVPADELMDRAVKAAQAMAAIPAATFAMTKRQIRRPAIEQMERTGAQIDADVIEIWAAAEATGRIRDYVERTLKRR